MPTILCQAVIQAPAERCFDLARNVDLHVHSSTGIGACAMGGRRYGLSEAGDTTTWSARFFGLRFRMTTRIENFAPSRSFGDRLTRGLLREFAHTYRFEPQPDGSCLMSDELRVAAPLGWLGRLVERVYLTRRMETLVRERLAHIKAAAEGEAWKRYLPATGG